MKNKEKIYKKLLFLVGIRKTAFWRLKNKMKENQLTSPAVYAIVFARDKI